MQHMSNLELIPTSEVARLAGRDVRTVNRWVKDGRLKPAVQGPGVRGPRMFRPSDVLNLLAEELAAKGGAA